ncbi:hypothetical protein RHECNPAF_1760037 [Rhizobium etli CNPAF512]|nr:hypothetical protein RHECNPAF_1760037 [Rhizobium etli CNPAF512]
MRWTRRRQRPSPASSPVRPIPIRRRILHEHAFPGRDRRPRTPCRLPVSDGGQRDRPRARHEPDRQRPCLWPDAADGALSEAAARRRAGLFAVERFAGSPLQGCARSQCRRHPDRRHPDQRQGLLRQRDQPQPQKFERHELGRQCSDLRLDAGIQDRSDLRLRHQHRRQGQDRAHRQAHPAGRRRRHRHPRKRQPRHLGFAGGAPEPGTAHPERRRYRASAGRQCGKPDLLRQDRRSPHLLWRPRPPDGSAAASARPAGRRPFLAALRPNDDGRRRLKRRSTEDEIRHADDDYRRRRPDPAWRRRRLGGRHDRRARDQGRQGGRRGQGRRGQEEGRGRPGAHLDRGQQRRPARADHLKPRLPLGKLGAAGSRAAVQRAA